MTKEYALEKYKETGYLTPQMQTVLEEAKIINGIGNKKYPIGSILHSIIPYITFFDKKKLESLLLSIEDYSKMHDVDFYIGGGRLKFYTSNLKFSFGMYKVFSWTKTSERLLISLVTFLVLILFSKPFFNFK